MLQPDDISHRIDLTEEQLAICFCSDQTSLTSESTTLVFVEGDATHRVVAFETFELRNQNSILQIMDCMLNESHLNLPGGEREEEEMEGGTTLASKPRETEVNLNPFLEDSLGRETDALVGRWASADAVFSINNSGEMEGE